MATVSFHKLHANGNDFVFIFSEKREFLLKNFIAKICCRKTGIGADGVFIISPDFVKHFDPDGSESFCVDGTLCLACLHKEKVFNLDEFFLFNTKITINVKNDSISFQVDNFKHTNIEVDGVKGDYVEIGNPHFFVKTKKIDFQQVNIFGKKLVNHKEFLSGANISFVEELGDNFFKIATFERGVNAITNCCGSACCAYVLSVERENNNICRFKFVPPSNMELTVLKNNNLLTVTGTVKYICKGIYYYD
jgi:diaminopimelate epimerase